MPGEMADEKVLLLVKGLCDSVKVKEEVKEEGLPNGLSPSISSDETFAEFFEEEELPVGSASISYDNTLAALFDMGYDLDVAIKAIQDCGSLDVAAIVDHMNTRPPHTTVDDPSSTALTVFTPSFSLQVKVKLEEEERHVSPDVSRPRIEASTSRAKASPECLYPDAILQEKQGFQSSKRPLSYHQSLDAHYKGKTPVTDSDEDALDSERWEHDDDPDTGNETSLLRMGFSEKDVTDALQSCGEDVDLNHLANYIINKIVDLPADDFGLEDSSLIEDIMAEDPMAEDPFVHSKLEDTKIGLEEDEESSEPTDQELSVFKKLHSMGFSFSLNMVSGAIKVCGKDAQEDALVDYLLRSEEKKLAGTGTSDDNDEWQNLTKLQQLKKLGCYSSAACMRAIDNNGDAGICELLDYLEAERLNDKFREEDEQLSEDDDEDDELPKFVPGKRRKTATPSKVAKRRLDDRGLKRKSSGKWEDKEEENSSQFHRNLKGFGLPGETVVPRQLREDINGPPYFYFENVALMPKDEWRNIQRHLYNIAPEFVDSLNFSPCRRPRGYIHNLPLEGRVEILPKPPMSIQELIPGSDRFWPTWDPRVKLNTINTRTASEFVRRQIQESLTACQNGSPEPKDIKTVLFWARKWNLVWIRPGVLAPLGPEEVEKCLGFDINHTRVLYSPVDRIRVLGNSFQVNTVAFHLSVLRPIYPNGIRVLSLFTGIGGAEVALHKLGIPLKVVVSIEIDDKARMVVDSWWKATNQKGKLIHSCHDVKELDSKSIQKLVAEFGGFDLVIGGSPCNNLSGNNRCTRVGLAGTVSVAFFEFPRILAEVRDCMSQRGE